MDWASVMATNDIIRELHELNMAIDAFERADDDDKCHGGSPGEGMYERHEELTHELRKRGVHETSY